MAAESLITFGIGVFLLLLVGLYAKKHRSEDDRHDRKSPQSEPVQGLPHS